MSSSTCFRRSKSNGLVRYSRAPELDRLDRAVDRGVRGHQNHFAAGHRRADLPQQIEAVHVGHAQIDHREIGGLAQQRAHRLGAAGAGDDVEADAVPRGARPPSAPGVRRRRRGEAAARPWSVVIGSCRADGPRSVPAHVVTGVSQIGRRIAHTVCGFGRAHGAHVGVIAHIAHTSSRRVACQRASSRMLAVLLRVDRLGRHDPDDARS